MRYAIESSSLLAVPRYSLDVAAELGLVGLDGVDLALASARWVEHVAEPLCDEALSVREADHALTEAEHLSVVREDCALYGERVVRGHCSDGRYLVGGDGDTETCALGQGRCQ